MVYADVRIFSNHICTQVHVLLTIAIFIDVYSDRLSVNRYVDIDSRISMCLLCRLFSSYLLIIVIFSLLAFLDRTILNECHDEQSSLSSMPRCLSHLDNNHVKPTNNKLLLEKDEMNDCRLSSY
jgi:hypothetical protein